MMDGWMDEGASFDILYLDFSKAFDKVIHEKLFEKVLEAKIHPIFIRLIVYAYRNQTAQVFWEGSFSRVFNIRNGVRQGAVLSPILFNLYTKDLFNLLEKIGGPRIGGEFFGVFGYADDLALFSNSRTHLQTMLEVTENYASVYNIQFSTNTIIAKSKTKGMIFGMQKGETMPENLILNGKKLPWVDDIKYLGTVVTNDHEVLEKDINMKRARYITNANTLVQEFSWAHPSIKCRINNIYNGNVYGSNLYPLRSNALDMLFNSHSVAIRIFFGIPRTTHKYIAAQIGGRHLKTQILANKINFFKRLEMNSKMAVVSLFNTVKNDLRTNTGRDCKILKNEGVRLGIIHPEGNCTDINTNYFIQQHTFAECPFEEHYRFDVLNELLSLRSQFTFFEDDSFTTEEINVMINDICTR